MAAKDKKDEAPATVFKVGGIALALLIIGYQSALFVNRAAQMHIAALRDTPDTVYVYLPEAESAALAAQARDGAASGSGSTSRGGGSPGGGAVVVRKNSEHSAKVEAVRRKTRRVESFRFNPNTVGVEDLMRLGFSEKQALAIDKYRSKGGRFRRPADFAKSFVVSDSVFERLRPFIDIPKLDINKADSAAFDELPGIGPYFAAKMVSYRGMLGGYSYKEQLMDIYHFDREKYDGLSDLIVCSPPPQAFRLWSLPEDSLKMHPYIKSWQTARSIVLFRNSMPRSEWSVEALGKAGILPEDYASRLARCKIEAP